MLGFRPLASGPLSEIRHAQITQTTVTTVRFASRSFVTRATDLPSQTFIDGRIGEGLRLNRQLSAAEDGQFGALLHTEFGEIQLRNNDGVLDDLSTRYAADGRQIRLKIGSTEFLASGKEDVQPFAQFVNVYIATAGPWLFEHNVLRLKIVDMVNRIRGQMQTEVYAGTGGSGGMAEIAGLTKPLMFGRMSNAPVQLVDPAILTYQLHSGNIQSVSAVYDAGVSAGLNFSADYPTYSALAAATVPASTYATSLESGHIRLGISPIGAVTVDARGHKDNITGNYIEGTPDLIRTILRDFGGLTSEELDSTGFTAMNALQPGHISFFLPAGDQSTVLDVVDRLAFAAGFVIGDRGGRITIQRLGPPSSTTVHWTFNDRDIIDIERLSLPYKVPWKSWGIGYGVNWTVQHDPDLATSVTQERRAFLKSERRYVYAQNTNIALFHATSAGAPLRDTFFVDAAVAEAEAARLIDLYGYGRAMYEVAVKNALFSVHVGETVHIIYHRWDLSSGKRFVVVGVVDDADRVETRLMLFG